MASTTVEIRLLTSVRQAFEELRSATLSEAYALGEVVCWEALEDAVIEAVLEAARPPRPPERLSDRVPQRPLARFGYGGQPPGAA